MKQNSIALSAYICKPVPLLLFVGTKYGFSWANPVNTGVLQRTVEVKIPYNPLHFLSEEITYPYSNHYYPIKFAKIPYQP